jgi:serine/threonine protein kinase
MQPPIPLGTLLQKRYRVTKVLGQGGFGRTYLSQDTGCFDEMCVLKEFSPNDRGRDALKKSKELFQREAQVLYQINHPQIPKFRANFEEQKRLFLVQEYAEGKTVAKSLSDRLKNNQTFTEAEAVEFLNNMLPVLSHIHGMGIIHRDISPDNVIFRDRDKLPVLIDFGVVKAGVTKLEASNEINQGTTVGKAGYAPGEQLQTGEAYANSDLYALAVTVVVMMTGRKPESLIDKSTMTWKWHQWVPTLTPWFAKILNKMLSRVPNSRYQSANEVAQALRSVSDFVGSPAGTVDRQVAEVSQAHGTLYPRPAHSNDNGGQSIPKESIPLSRIKRSTGVNSNVNLSNNNTPQNPLRGIFNTPWGIALGSGVAALVFIILPIFLISRSMTVPSTGTKSTPPTPIATTPTATVPPGSATTPPPAANPVTPAPTVAPTATTESLSLEVGKATVKEGALNPAQSIVYTIPLQVGQQLKATLTANPPGATMNILAPNQANVDVFAKNTVNWQGNLPLSGEYRIEIVSPAGAVASNYKLDTILSNSLPSTPPPTTPATTPAPIPTPIPATTP